MMLTVPAPAKLNLTLEVLGKRGDGYYHEIRSIVQAIDLCDRLHFRESQQIEFKCSMPGWIAEQSLVSKATDLVRSATGYTGGVMIEVDKHIPLMSGLGGDSSNATAVLLGLDRLWNLNMSRERLLELAAELGSDVAFFLSGGTALMEGRGERITPLPPLGGIWFVLVVPDVSREPGKTGRAYATLKETDYTNGQPTERFVKVLEGGGEIVPSMLFNVFERTVFKDQSDIDRCRKQMIAAGAENVHLAGSGPALFSMAGDRGAADEMYHRLQKHGVEVYQVRTLAARKWPDDRSVTTG